MSETTRGVIGMPFEMAMSSELSRRQFHSIAQSLLAERDRLKAGVDSDMAEIDRIQGEYDKQFRKARELRIERDQLKAENEALRKFIIGLAEGDAQIAYAYADLVAELSHD
jgi:uncharacterized coiled-coil DUF342 family protein